MGVLPDWQIQRDIVIEPFAAEAARPGVISYGVSSYGYDVRVGRKYKVFEPYHEINSMRDVAAAWLAGIIDGEGCLSVHDKGVRLTVTNTDKEMLELARSLTGVGQIYEKDDGDPKHKVRYDWVVTRSRHVQELLVRVLPYMVIKRAKALDLIGKTFKREGIGMPIVDPKNFPQDSFVDMEGDHCIIPPNSFALAETVEYLEIPRDIIAVCVGKSSFARCGIIVNVTPLEPEWRGKVTLEISNTTPLPAKIYSNEGIAQILFFRADDVCKVSYADKRGKYQDQQGLTLPFVQGSKASQ
jgi:deoxycytidine triphosphate deaminase